MGMSIPTDPGRIIGPEADDTRSLHEVFRDCRRVDYEPEGTITRENRCKICGEWFRVPRGAHGYELFICGGCRS